MIWTVVEEQIIEKEAKKHAGGKARADLSSIFTACGFSAIQIAAPQQERANAGVVSKTYYHWRIRKEWEKAVRAIKPGDTLVLQFPVINHTLFLDGVLKNLAQRGVRLVAFIHDLDMIRFSQYQKLSTVMRWRMKKEEEEELRFFDKLIVHNDKMKAFLCDRLNIPLSRMETLGIFDYLIDDNYQPQESTDRLTDCIIAGNLSRKKAGYVYQLPGRPDFRLYGIKYESYDQPNIHYYGSFLPEELPYHLTGGFGLVWDGDSAETCEGSWGNYLRYNNPHKTSLYLACGIPVIIWEEAAMADYIRKNRAGITVKSLHDIESRLAEMSPEEYRTLKRNAVSLSAGIRSGKHTRSVLMRAGIRAEKATGHETGGA